MRKRSGKVYDHRAYRPTAFVDIATGVSIIGLILGGYVSGSVGPLILMPGPIVAWHLLKNYIQPLRKTMVVKSGEEIVLRFPGPPPSLQAEKGLLRVTYDQSKHWSEITSLEFDKDEDVELKLADEKSLVIPPGELFLGVATNPLTIALEVRKAYRLKTPHGSVYLASTRPYSGEIVGEPDLDASVTDDGRVVEFTVSPGDKVYSYAECCGFQTKKVLVAEPERRERVNVRLGLPGDPGFLLVPRKPYLPSLAGVMLESIGFPSSYYVATRDAVMVIEVLSSKGTKRYVRIRGREEEL